MGKTRQEAVTLEMVLNRLRGHLNKQKPVTLFNTYGGVPITYEADVALIHPDNTIGLIVHPYQTVCIKHERRTYIESKSLPELVSAYPVSIDYTNCVVVLKDLAIPKSISNNLNHSWVMPESDGRVEISSVEHGECMGKLMEIAVLEDNEIRVGMSVDEGVPHQRGDVVELAFRLMAGGSLIQVQGLIDSLSSIHNQDQKRMEFAGKAAMGDEISILAFVARREDQVMAELDKAYKHMRKGKRKKSE
jgi:hypothetical protein